MPLVKTESGKVALLNRDLGLKPRMRQVLILANGVHSRESIQDLMERDIGAELHWLLASGFLEETVDPRYAVKRLLIPRGAWSPSATTSSWAGDTPTSTKAE